MSHGPGNVHEMAEPLRRAVAADLRPVRPLPPPWQRVLWALPVAVVICGGTFMYFGIRSDAGDLGPLLAWAPVGMQVALGLALLVMALHEAVPGLRLPRGVAVGCVVAALAIHLTVNLLIWTRHPLGYASFLRSWWPCFSYELMLGVPFLALITYLAVRALPMQPRVIGLLAGLGGGLIADASWRMVCPVSVPSHFLTAHLGSVLALGAAGYGLGLWIEVRRRRAAA
jgi:hypothetical protein